MQSARCQDKQNQMERKELKVELDKERDARQTLQRQLSSELQTRGESSWRRKRRSERRLFTGSLPPSSVHPEEAEEGEEGKAEAAGGAGL